MYVHKCTQQIDSIIKRLTAWYAIWSNNCKTQWTEMFLSRAILAVVIMRWHMEFQYGETALKLSEHFCFKKDTSWTFVVWALVYLVGNSFQTFIMTLLALFSIESADVVSRKPNSSPTNNKVHLYDTQASRDQHVPHVKKALEKWQITWPVCVRIFDKLSPEDPGRIEIWIIKKKTYEIPNQTEPVHPGEVFWFWKTDDHGLIHYRRNHFKY